MVFNSKNPLFDAVKWWGETHVKPTGFFEVGSTAPVLYLFSGIPGSIGRDIRFIPEG